MIDVVILNVSRKISDVKADRVIWGHGSAPPSRGIIISKTTIKLKKKYLPKTRHKINNKPITNYRSKDYHYH